ncbi:MULTISPECIES: nuclear transport factor 2 family protein [unclassified Mycobacterium]|uniref:nuclear transport factor 2 family protein n=1 Tax=unclassified Mycobacterium TaxID=2642494 RepID=UPI000895BA5B|nr:MULTISPECIES: nuclear transport factor 2 family protein [unclassified Mycobacterium]SEA39466.1 SnoaL-like domain-containing protein [Mycobacterium sp. 283mftsu]
MMRVAVALSATVAFGAGAAPISHAASEVSTASSASTAASVGSVGDASAETAAVELLKATYFNDVDTKNWLALRRLFAPDAVVDTTGSFGPYFPSRDSFITFTAVTLSAINTRHQGYDPQIELTSATTATAVWTMQDRLSLAGLVTIHGYGHYTDTYEQVNGQWLITRSKLTRTGFGVEFPAFQDFANGLGNAYKSGGLVATLVYAVPAAVNIPVKAVTALVGAIASNFGGPPAKAQQITVPPGSTGVTTEPPGITSTGAQASPLAKKQGLGSSPTTKMPAGANGTPVAGVADAAALPTHVNSQAREAVRDRHGANIDSTSKSPKTSDSPTSVRGTVEGAKSTTPTRAGDRAKKTMPTPATDKAKRATPGETGGSIKPDSRT